MRGFKQGNTALALVVAAAFAPIASAQRPIELGIDALSLGVTVAGGTSVTSLSVPTGVFRVGFFASERVSIEPNLGVTYIKVEDQDAVTLLNFALGLLYHFTPPGQRSQVYIRPLLGISFLDPGLGDSATQFSAGGGLGVKVPLVGRLAARLEAQYTHRFENADFAGSNSIVGLFGFSFFTR